MAETSMKAALLQAMKTVEQKGGTVAVPHNTSDAVFGVTLVDGKPTPFVQHEGHLEHPRDTLNAILASR